MPNMPGKQRAWNTTPGCNYINCDYEFQNDI